MESPLDEQLSREELQRQREQIRRSFLRANTAVALILAAVLALAVAAVLEALRAARHSRRAETAEQDGREKLWRSYLAQVRAGRMSGLMGRRAEGLETIRAAAAIRPGLELRNEALACLALTDLEEDGPQWTVPSGLFLYTFDNSSQRYALGDGTGTIVIRRLAQDIELLRLSGMDAGLPKGRAAWSMQFSPDGRYLAARFDGGAVVVWDLASSQPIFTNGVNVTNIISGSPQFIDGRSLLGFANSARQGELSLFDFLTGQEVPLGRVFAAGRPFAFQPGEKVVAVADDREVILWNWEKREEQRRLAHETTIESLAWDHQGRRLACAATFADVTLWDTETGSSRSLAGHGYSVRSLAFSHDGTMLATGSPDGFARLWDTEWGRLLCSTDRGYARAFTDDDSKIVFEQPGRVGTWRVNRGAIYRTLLVQEARNRNVWNQDLSPDGRWLVWGVGALSALRLWDMTSNKAPLVFPVENLRSIAFHSQKPALFICHDQTLELRPIEPASAGETVAARLGEARTIPLPPGARPREFAVSADGHTLIVEGFGRRVYVVDVEKPGHFVYLDSRSSELSNHGPASETGSGHMAISPDARWVVVGFGQVGQAGPSIWDARTGKLVKSLGVKPANIAFSRDGKQLLTSSLDQNVLWSVGDWRPIWRMHREGLPVGQGAAAFTRDGSLVAVADSPQHVKLLEGATGREVGSLTSADPLSITGLRMNSDGSSVIVATPHGAFQLWDLERAHKELAAMHLDWNEAPLLPASVSLAAQWWQGTPGAIALGLTLLVAIVFSALFVLRRHRQLIQDFARTETLAARRDRQLEMARVELLHSEKMKALGTLAAGIAHDFNNLLSVVRMANKLIARQVPDNPEVSENVADIEKAVEQGKNLVRSMLGYSRDTPDDGSPQDIIEVVEGTVALLSKEFLSGIQLTLEFDRRAPRAPVSRGRLEQILLNLLVNAAEAMKGRGKLTITVGRQSSLNGAFVLRPKPAPQHIELTVTDSGPGMDPEIMPRIFEPFFTTKVSGTQRGTGLGLSMVYSLAEQEGLGLGVETQRGKGTTFHVVIPVNGEAAKIG